MDNASAALKRIANIDHTEAAMPSSQAVESSRAMRQSLDEEDFRWLCFDESNAASIRRERHRVFRQHLGLFELELQLTRRLRRRAMAESQDWSGFRSYVVESVLLWKPRLMLRVAGYLFRLGIPGARDFVDAAVYVALRRLYFAAPA